jgi:hypothetical protein
MDWISNLLSSETTRDSLYKSLSHRPVFSVTVFTALLGDGFQQWTFLCIRAHVLAGWRPSHTSLLLFSLPSQGSPVMAAGPHYIVSGRTAKKTSSIISCSLLAGETLSSQRCSLATILVPSPVYTAITSQWVCMSRFRCVTIDGVWIGEWIYWPLMHITRNYKHLQHYRYSTHFTNH